MNWFFKQKDTSKLTFYWTAIKSGNDECLRMFLKSGWIDVNELNDDGDSPMFVAVKYGHLNVLKALLLSNKYYRFCKKYEDEIDVNNPQVIVDAEIQGDIYKTDVFILLDIRPSQQTHRWFPNSLFQKNKQNGRNIFHACALGCHIDTLEFLYSYYRLFNLNLNYFDKHSFNGETPVMLATKCGPRATYIIEFFLKHGANIAATDNSGLTVLNSIILHIPDSTELLADMLNHCVKIDKTAIGLEEESGGMEIDLNLLCPVNEPQMKVLKLLHTSMKSINRNKVLHHPVIKTFVHLKWIAVKNMFIQRFALACLSTLLFTVLLTMTINKDISQHLMLYKVGKLILIISDIHGIIFSLPLLTVQGLWFLTFLNIVLTMLPCLLTILYLLLHKDTLFASEVASVSMIMS